MTAVRCSAPHPKFPGWECRAVLVEQVMEDARIIPGAWTGCVVIRCDRCGTLYSVCPTLTPHAERL